ncbi:MAG TPA: alpha-L-rhamnosidase N-terminal domain-containing protein, partial [Polyangiaceae bacterium]
MLGRPAMNAESPHRLRCEYLKNPIGIDIRKPRLSWELRDPRRGAQQSAFRIQVSSSSAALHSGAADVWDSGKVDSAESVHLVYGGPELQARLRYFWRVCTWDTQGEPSSWSESAFWEMGILSREDWKAEFIGSSTVGGRNTTVPVPFFRKVFTLSKPVASARAYVTALGLYELHLNGEIIGDQVFAPGWTDYRRRVTYQVYDITDRLRTGPNAIGAILGDGWYSGYVGWLAR